MRRTLDLPAGWGNMACSTIPRDRTKLALEHREPDLVAFDLGGTEVYTMPFEILWQLVEDPLTDLGRSKFLDDWAKPPK